VADKNKQQIDGQHAASSEWFCAGHGASDRSRMTEVAVPWWCPAGTETSPATDPLACEITGPNALARGAGSARINRTSRPEMNLRKRNR
jgi:hypothetical protein